MTTPLRLQLVRQLTPFFTFAVLATSFTAAAEPADPPPDRFAEDIAKFEAADRDSPPRPGGTLFVGSSSFRLWTSLAESFPDRHVLNRGFGGSQLSDVLAFVDRIVLPYRPAEILVYAGDNDLKDGKSPERILRDFRALVERVRAALPDTKIFFVAIKPSPARVQLLPTAARANQLIAQFCEDTSNVDYIDIFTPMLDASGQPRDELFVKDRLHLNEAGYALWTEVVRRSLGPPPASAQ